MLLPNQKFKTNAPYCSGGFDISVPSFAAAAALKDTDFNNT
jgi:hypothetical protein